MLCCRVLIREVLGIELMQHVSSSAEKAGLVSDKSLAMNAVCVQCVQCVPSLSDQHNFSYLMFHSHVSQDIFKHIYFLSAQEVLVDGAVKSFSYSIFYCHVLALCYICLI